MPNIASSCIDPKVKAFPLSSIVPETFTLWAWINWIASEKLICLIFGTCIAMGHLFVLEAPLSQLSGMYMKLFPFAWQMWEAFRTPLGRHCIWEGDRCAAKGVGSENVCENKWVSSCLWCPPWECICHCARSVLGLFCSVLTVWAWDSSTSYTWHCFVASVGAFYVLLGCFVCKVLPHNFLHIK